MTVSYPGSAALGAARLLLSPASVLSTSLAAGLAVQLTLVVSGILVARLLEVEDRGHLALLLLLPALVAQVAALGTPAALTYELARRPAAAGQLLSQIIPLLVTQFVFAGAGHAALVALFAPRASTELVQAAWFSLSATPLLLVQHYSLGILQAEAGSRRFHGYRLLPPLAGSAVALFALVNDIRALGQFVQLTIAALALTSVLLALAARNAVRQLGEGPNQQLPSRRSLLSFALRGFWGSSSPAESFRIDQLFVGVVLSATDLALYVIALSFTNLPRFLAQSIGNVAYPVVASRPRPSDMVNATWRYVRFAALICTSVVVVIEIFAGYLVPVFFGASYADAVPLTRLLLISSLCLSVRRVIGDGARGTGHPECASIAEIALWGSLIPSMIYLAPLWGVLGVGVAVVVSSLVSISAILAAFTLCARRKALAC